MNYGLDGFQRAKWRARKWLHNLAKRILRPLKINWTKHVSKTYILHLEDREDRKELLSKELSQVLTHKGTLLDHVIWLPAVKNVIKWPAHWHVNKYSFDLHWVVDPDPQHLPELDKFEDLKIDCSPAETAIASKWLLHLASDLPGTEGHFDEVGWGRGISVSGTSGKKGTLPPDVPEDGCMYGDFKDLIVHTRAAES